jgi:amidase
VNELTWLSAVEQLTLLERGDITAAELRDAGIEACEALDPSLGFLVSALFDRAPPGVPMVLKDAGQEIAGTPHFVGVAALRDIDSRSSATTALAARFEELGFSIIGKAACPSLSTAITTEPFGFPPTRNPWDVARSVGGSSGGSAAAVSAGAVAVAHGSDATGSLRCPAALCSVVTLNPTSGRIPSVAPAGQPPSPVWRDFVLVRHAVDLTLVFELLTGATVTPFDAPLRIGILDHDPEMGFDVDPACAEGTRRVGRLLESLGHHVEPSWPATLNHLWKDTFAALAVVADAARPMMIAWVSSRLGRRVQHSELDETVFEAANRATTRSDDDVRAAHATIENTVALLDEWWHGFDVLLTPSTFQPAWSLGGSPGPRELGTLAAPFSLARQPSLSVPAGWSPDGLPVGAQLVARRGNDELLLDLATRLQEADDWTTRRPPHGLGQSA